jgi:hypothetical protein
VTGFSKFAKEELWVLFTFLEVEVVVLTFNLSIGVGKDGDVETNSTRLPTAILCFFEEALPKLGMKELGGIQELEILGWSMKVLVFGSYWYVKGGVL